MHITNDFLLNDLRLHFNLARSYFTLRCGFVLFLYDGVSLQYPSKRIYLDFWYEAKCNTSYSQRSVLSAVCEVGILKVLRDLSSAEPIRMFSWGNKDIQSGGLQPHLIISE